MERMEAKLNIRTTTEVKENAKQIYEQLGIDISTAVNVFLRKSIEYGGFPFNVRLDRPNPKTVDAIVKAEKGIDIESFESVDDLWENLDV